MEDRLTVFDIFNRAFEANLNSSHTHQEAFEKADTTIRATFGFSQYTSFESFKNVRYRKLRMKLRK